MPLSRLAPPTLKPSSVCPSGPSSKLLVLPLVMLWSAWSATAPAWSDVGGSPTQDSSAAFVPWTVDDLVEHEALGSIDLTPDGNTVAWVQTKVQEGKSGPTRIGRLFLARLDSQGEALPLTHGHERFGRIAFSPDGTNLAFLSDRPLPASGSSDTETKDGTTQIWLLPVGGGEAKALTKGDVDIDDFRWIDADTLLFSRSEAASLRRQDLEENHDEAFAVDDPRDNPPQRLFSVDREGRVRRLTLDPDWIQEMEISPEGHRAVVTAAQSTRYAFDAKIPPKTFLVDLETGNRTEILAGSGLQARSFVWADAETLYFIDDFTNHPTYRQATVAHLYRFDVKTGTPHRVEHGMERGIGNGYSVVPGGLVALMADGTRYTAARIAGSRAVELETPPSHGDHLDSLQVSADGTRVVYVRSTADEAPQLWSAALGKAGWTTARRLTSLNEGYAPKPRGKTEIVRWKGAAGDLVEGVLSYPFGWQEGKAYPLILDIHGGPTGYDRHSWDANWASPTPLWRQRGAFVFRVNYHGSGNYGLDWAESIRERYYELEVPDIESGVDMLIERGLVDADRLATTGWSNGGILSAALIVHTDRYKAAVVGAADVEWISDWGNVDFGAAFDNYYFGGPPWQRLEHYVEKSPFFSVETISTPTLLHTGTEDRNVPPHQSWSMFRALQFVEKTDTRLILYPGEPHGLHSIAHQKRKIREDLEWLDRHLFGADKGHDPVPETSRLAAHLDLLTASRVEGRLGTSAASTLIPETVPIAGIEIGRFEVTVDQWRAFAAQAPGVESFAERDGDLPAAGITFDSAQRYVRWLAELTGRPFALPTATELASLEAVGSGSDENGANTLKRWIGAAPDPDDRRALLQHLKDRGTHLLVAVGRSGSRLVETAGGPTRIYDLDGNVAEWVTDEDGSGEPFGDSADRNSGSELEVDPSYIGLRVVVRP